MICNELYLKLEINEREIHEERDRNQIKEDLLEKENRVLRLKVQVIESNLLKLKQSIIDGEADDWWLKL